MIIFISLNSKNILLKLLARQYLNRTGNLSKQYSMSCDKTGMYNDKNVMMNYRQYVYRLISVFIRVCPGKVGRFFKLT